MIEATIRAKRLAAMLLFASVVGSAGCSTTKSLSNEMATMQGAPAGYATALWGEPHAIEDFDDGSLMIWRDYAGAFTGAVMPVVICERQLAVDADGSITGWRWRGDACDSIYRDRAADHPLQARRR